MGIESVKRYINKKGIGYFINDPSEEDKKALSGIIFDDRGFLMMSNLYKLAGVSI